MSAWFFCTNGGSPEPSWKSGWYCRNGDAVFCSGGTITNQSYCNNGCFNGECNT